MFSLVNKGYAIQTSLGKHQSDIYIGFNAVETYTVNYHRQKEQRSINSFHPEARLLFNLSNFVKRLNEDIEGKTIQNYMD